MYCIHKNIHEAELPRRLPHRDVREAGVVLNPCMGDHHIVTCNGTADDLTTKGVQDGAAGGVFDDELDQVHGGVGEASAGFDEENGKVLGVIHEIAEDWAVPGPFSRLVCVSLCVCACVCVYVCVWSFN